MLGCGEYLRCRSARSWVGGRRAAHRPRPPGRSHGTARREPGRSSRARASSGAISSTLSPDACGFCAPARRQRPRRGSCARPRKSPTRRGASATRDSRPVGRRVKHWWSVLVVGFLLAVPLILTCVWLYANDRWAPVLDLAVTELRVRDVGTAHTPLVGLFGRFGPMGNDQGSHPGPLSFYLLAPVYRLLGVSYWALRVSTVALNAAAIACALLIAQRRAGLAGVLAAGLGIASLQLGFGLL